MNVRRFKTITLCVAGSWCLTAAGGCVQAPPPELVQTVEALDGQLTEVGGAEFAPEEYAHFVERWVSLKHRLEDDDDLIRWPWEPNRVADEVSQVAQEAVQTLSLAMQRREELRRTTEEQVEEAETRLSTLKQRVEDLGSRSVIGKQLIQTELLIHQAKTVFEQGRYARALELSQIALQSVGSQTVSLTRVLGRYADEEQVQAWQQMAARTIQWSRSSRAQALIVNKAARQLTLYRNGQPVHTYPVRLGFNGMLEKRHQGDGATPEGQYRILRKHGPGATKFYRAFLLDYPNADDRRRYDHSSDSGEVPNGRGIGGSIEIHGQDDHGLAQTLGCIMLDNSQIVHLYEQVSPGTPVTIVGALDVDNRVSQALGDLAEFAAE
ncbi:MAG: L,D-transpeptidase [Nitrospiraceae bacterium]